MNMETIQEKDIDESLQENEVQLFALEEKSQSLRHSSSSSQASPVRAVESSDDEVISQKSQTSEAKYQIPKDDDPAPQENE